MLRQLAAHQPLPEIIVVSANDSLETAVEAMRLGASDYITKPYEVSKLRAIARRAMERVSLMAKSTSFASNSIVGEEWVR